MFYILPDLEIEVEDTTRWEKEAEPNRLETVEGESGKWVQELPLIIRKFNGWKWSGKIKKKRFQPR